MGTLRLAYRMERWGLRRPLQTSKGPISERIGIVLEVGEQDERAEARGMSVASPLPGWSLEAHGDILESLQRLPAELPEFDADAPDRLDAWLDQHEVSIPSVRFGLASALMDHQAKRTGSSWGALLAPGASQRVEVARLCRSHDEARQAYSLGVRTFKLKAGMSLEQETRLLADVVALGHDVLVRVDVNRGWTFDQAIAAWNEWRPFHSRIEFIEEPLKDAFLGRTFELQDYGVPLAFDESVRTRADILELADRDLKGVVVLKPSLIGTPLEVLKLAELSSQLGFSAMVSNLIEPSVVRLYCAHLAGLINSGIAAGIGTGGLLAEDLGDLELTPDATVPLGTLQTSQGVFQ